MAAHSVSYAGLTSVSIHFHKELHAKKPEAVMAIEAAVMTLMPEMAR
jgi:hypothetical protein